MTSTFSKRHGSESKDRRTEGGEVLAASTGAGTVRMRAGEARGPSPPHGCRYSGTVSGSWRHTSFRACSAKSLFPYRVVLHTRLDDFAHLS
jgi:hypothetical protein